MSSRFMAANYGIVPPAASQQSGLAWRTARRLDQVSSLLTSRVANFPYAAIVKGSVSRIVIFAYIFFPVASSNTIERPCADVWQSIPWSSAQLCGQHDFALVSFWRFHNPMKVVAQQTPSMNLPPSLLTIFSQRFHEPNMILFIFKNVLSATPTVHHMVHRPSNTASRSTRIVFSLAADSRGGKSRSRQNGFHCAWRTQ